MNSILQ